MLFLPKICIPLSGFRIIWAVQATATTTPTPVSEVFFGHDTISLFASVVMDAFNKVIVKADVIQIIAHTFNIYTLILTRKNVVSSKILRSILSFRAHFTIVDFNFYLIPIKYTVHCASFQPVTEGFKKHFSGLKGILTGFTMLRV